MKNMSQTVAYFCQACKDKFFDMDAESTTMYAVHLGDYLKVHYEDQEGNNLCGQTHSDHLPTPIQQ